MGGKNEKTPDPRKVNIVRSLFLEKLLRDRQPERILEAPEAVQCGLRLPGRLFYLARGEYIDSQDPSAPEAAGAEIPRSYSALLAATQETVLCELNNSRFTTYSCVIDEDPFFLICLAPDIDPLSDTDRWALQEELRALFTRAQKALREQYALSLQIWFSDLIEGVRELRAEFQNMDSEDLAPLTQKPVMFPDDMAPYLLSPEGLAARKLQDLEQRAILTAMDHDWQGCYDAFHQLIGYETNYFPLCNHIHDRAIERLTQVFNVSGVPMNNALIPSLRSHIWRRNLQACVSPDEVDAIVKEVLLTCGELFQPSVSVSARVPEIVRFVEEHLFDPNLCADLVCSRFDISLSYLSRIFKESQQIKFIDYIHEKRIEASKALLLGTSPVLTVDAVAERVGYSSALTFTRAFKRIEGLTPGAFRRVCGGKPEADR